ncbi:MAG: CoA pyrophosphatase [Geminicoccaceae bacterium]|nr:MAG: CoA pyrophosphatase [Geminicoccaceae bacterium]
MRTPLALTPGAIRERIRQRPPMELITGDQGHRAISPQKTPAAVLIGVVGHDEPTVILTQRTAHLRDHAGQISFPGGRMEPDDPDPAATALRETAEEIGLSPAHCRILGELNPYDTVTGYRVHPVVAWIEPPFGLAPDPFEVAEVFEVPLGFVLDAQNHRRDSYDKGGLTRHYWVLPYQKRYIWGATAAMLVNFARLLNGAEAVLDPPP